MKRVKTLALYSLAIIGFFLLSELLINASLESQYRKIGRRDNINQVTIEQAEATKVNGRIKGNIKNTKENQINGKYLKFDFYTARDVKMGTKYIDIQDLKIAENDSAEKNKEIEMYFKLENVSYYDISVVDEKTEKEIELLPHNLTQTEVLVGTIVTLLILW